LAALYQLKRVILGFAACVFLLFIVTKGATKFQSGFMGVVAGIALIGAAIMGWRIIFDGGTLISHRLEGDARRAFNYAASVVVPASASIWFLQGVAPSDIRVSLEGLLLSWSSWVLLGFLVAIAWSAADQIDSQHFFRGLFIAATILWVVHAAPPGSLHSSDDDDWYYEDTEDDDQPNPANQFVLFVVQTTAVYGAILLKHGRTKT
jgi:hypothetical protein